MMATPLKYSTTSHKHLIGPMIYTSDGSAYTAAIPSTDIQIWKENSTALTNPSTGLAHISGGKYTLAFTSNETDTLGAFSLLVGSTTIMVYRQDYVILPANVYDSIIAGSSNLNTEVVTKTGFSLTVTPPTATAIRQEIDANSSQISTILTNTTSLLGNSTTLLGYSTTLLGNSTTLLGYSTTLLAYSTTIDGIVDDILVDTGTTLPDTLKTIRALTGERVSEGTFTYTSDGYCSGSVTIFRGATGDAVDTVTMTATYTTDGELSTFATVGSTT